MSFVPHDAMSMVEVPNDGHYRLLDLRSMGFIARSLTKSAYIKSWSFNSREEPVRVLARALKLDAAARQSDRYTGAGLFNVAVHFSRAAIAASLLYAAYRKENGHLGLPSLDMQTPDVVRNRVVFGLATAFFLPESVISDVLGPMETLSVLKTHKWFPEMKWVQRDVKDSSVVLWPSIHTRADEVEKQLLELHTLPDPEPYDPNDATDDMDIETE